MRFVMLALIVLVACVARAEASNAPQLGIKATCQCADACPCDPAGCKCPKVVTFPNGRKSLWVPGPVDTRNAWPYQGPFRWTGAVGRWTVGARPRFR